MAIEIVVGLFIKDEELYKKYREGMSPILKSYGGAFGYDFEVSKVLKSEVSEPINRVFTIFFENEVIMDEFFSDENYLEVKKNYFEPSVLATTIISKYER